MFLVETEGNDSQTMKLAEIVATFFLDSVTEFEGAGLQRQGLLRVRGWLPRLVVECLEVFAPRRVSHAPPRLFGVAPWHHL